MHHPAEEPEEVDRYQINLLVTFHSHDNNEQFSNSIYQNNEALQEDEIFKDDSVYPNNTQFNNSDLAY